MALKRGGEFYRKLDCHDLPRKHDGVQKPEVFCGTVVLNPCSEPPSPVVLSRMQTWVVFREEPSPDYQQNRHIIHEKHFAPNLSAVVDTSPKVEAEYQTETPMSLGAIIL